MQVLFILNHAHAVRIYHESLLLYRQQCLIQLPTSNWTDTQHKLQDMMYQHRADMLSHPAGNRYCTAVICQTKWNFNRWFEKETFVWLSLNSYKVLSCSCEDPTNIFVRHSKIHKHTNISACLAPGNLENSFIFSILGIRIVQKQKAILKAVLNKEHFILLCCKAGHLVIFKASILIRRSNDSSVMDYL